MKINKIEKLINLYTPLITNKIMTLCRTLITYMLFFINGINVVIFYAVEVGEDDYDEYKEILNKHYLEGGKFHVFKIEAERRDIVNFLKKRKTSMYFGDMNDKVKIMKHINYDSNMLRPTTELSVCFKHLKQIADADEDKKLMKFNYEMNNNKCVLELNWEKIMAHTKSIEYGFN